MEEIRRVQRNPLHQKVVDRFRDTCGELGIDCAFQASGRLRTKNDAPGNARVRFVAGTATTGQFQSPFPSKQWVAQGSAGPPLCSGLTHPQRRK